jgi:cytochrome b561
MRSTTHYNGIAKLLHWKIALLIICAFCLGLVMVDMPGISLTKLKYFNWHKWMGITVLGLSAIRLLWRLFSAPPTSLNLPAWQQRASTAVHYLLLAMTFAMPLSGYFYTLAAGYPVVFLGIFPLPVLMDANPALKVPLRDLHEILAYTLAALVALHAAAALKHHFLDKDDVLKRMLPRFSRN